MRRLVLAGGIVLAAGFSVIAQLALGATASTPAEHAYLETFVCHRALESSKRLVSVTAVMRPLSGTRRMGIRFQLLGKDAGRTTAVRGGDLGTWISPHPITLGQQPADVWIVRHPVTGVPVPGSYRFRVSFRWTGSDHRMIGETVHWSEACWQPDMRPDLLVSSIHVSPLIGNATEDRYVAVIANIGLTSARSVEVQFAPGGGAADQTVTIPKLDAHAERHEVFLGPVCTAATDPTVIVDPQHHINDLDPADNSLTATCPAQTPPAPS